MNFLLLKLLIFAALAAPAAAASSDGVYVHEEQSSLLRGSEQLGYLEKVNRCATRSNPMNCIDCIGASGNQPLVCDENSDYSVPFNCEEGQKFCCTVSNIKNTDFKDESRYGMCYEQGSGHAQCIKDGEEVWMDLYKTPYGPQVDTPVDSLCCSGKCADCTCMSATGMDKDGRSTYGGSCSGTCGAGQGTVKII